MRFNEFMDIMNSIKEVMEDDDIDIDIDIVTVGKDENGTRIGNSDLKLNYVNDISFDRENKFVKIYYNNVNMAV